MYVHFQPQISTSQNAHYMPASVQSCKNFSPLTFCGEEGDEFLKRVDNGMTESGLYTYIVNRLTNGVGVLKKDKVQDVLESVIERLYAEQESISKSKQNIETKENELEQRENQLAKKEADLKVKERTIREETRQNETEIIRQEVMQLINNEFENKRSELEKQYETKCQELKEQYEAKKQELEKQEQNLQERIDAMDAYEKEVQKGAREQAEQDLSAQKQAFEDDMKNRKQKLADEIKAQRQELDRKEQDLKVRLEASDQFFEIAKSSLRATYNIPDPNVTTYDSLGEQMVQVAAFINKYSSIFTSDRGTSMQLIDLLKNKEGKIPVDVIAFLDRIFGVKAEKADMHLLRTVIASVMDKEGHIDPEKASVFIGNYSLGSESLNSTLGFMYNTFSYRPENSYEGVVEEMRRVYANSIFKNSKGMTSYRERNNWEINVDEEGFMHISYHNGVLYPDNYDNFNSDKAFENIKTIAAEELDLTGCSLTDIGALEHVFGNLRYRKDQNIDGIDKVEVSGLKIVEDPDEHKDIHNNEHNSMSDYDRISYIL